MLVPNLYICTYILHTYLCQPTKICLCVLLLWILDLARPPDLLVDPPQVVGAGGILLVQPGLQLLDSHQGVAPPEPCRVEASFSFWDKV